MSDYRDEDDVRAAVEYSFLSDEDKRVCDTLVGVGYSLYAALNLTITSRPQAAEAADA